MTHGSPFQHILCPRYWEDDLVASCPVWMIEAALSRRTAEYARWVYLTIVMSGAAGLTLKGHGRDGP